MQGIGAEMELANVKLFCQSHFSDGLVTIVGSGLSVAEGISGMDALATHLQSHVPSRIDRGSHDNWSKISKALASGIDLETALLSHAPTDQVEAAIVALTADLILADEGRVLGEVLNNDRCLRFTKLLKHMLKPNNGIPIITTNYDRLIEVAVESAGLGIDSLFTGHHIARHDPVGSRSSPLSPREGRSERGRKAGARDIRTHCEGRSQVWCVVGCSESASF
jgi:hypothetical protein